MREVAKVTETLASDTRVVTTTPLRAYPGWVVRKFVDGWFDAIQTDGPGLTTGHRSFMATVADVRTLARPARTPEPTPATPVVEGSLVALARAIAGGGAGDGA